MTSVSPKSSLQLYRDCLRLIRHVAGNSPKAAHLRQIVSGQFRKNMNLTDEMQIHEAKQSAERVLSNYFLFEHLQKDPKLQDVQKRSWEQTEAAEAAYQQALMGGFMPDSASVADGGDESLYPDTDKDKP